MNVNDTVRWSIWHFPNLYHSRATVLHDLFYVIGNGYEWQDGELVYPFAGTRRDEDAYSTFRHESSLRGHNDPILSEVYERSRRQWNTEVDEVRSRIDELVNDMTFPSERPYPQCKEYAKAYNLPDDIKPDWAEAAAEIAAIIEPLYAAQQNREG